MLKLATTAGIWAAMLAAASGARADEGAARDGAGRPKLEVGERLVYSVRVGGIAAGQATLAVEGEVHRDGGRAYRVSLTVRSNRFASAFKPIDDRAVSVVHGTTLHSLGFLAVKNEGAKRSRETITPDYGKLTARTVRAREGRSTKRRDLELPGRVHDAVSWFYALRGMELRPGEPEVLVVATAKRVVALKIERVGKDRVDVRGHGRVRAIKVVVAEGGEALFGKEGSVTLWLSRESLVPLRIVVDAGGTSVALYLAETSRSPLDRRG